MKRLLLAVAMAASVLLSGCGGSEDDGGDGAGGGSGAGSAPPVSGSSTCTNSSAGPNGQNTCKELERIGGLINTFTDLMSLGASSSIDRVGKLSTSAAYNCPAGGTLQAAGTYPSITVTYQSCDAGYGAWSGTVASDYRDLNTYLTVDVSKGALRYKGTGSVFLRQDAAWSPQVFFNGTLSTGADSITAELIGDLAPISGESYFASIIVQHRRNLSVGTALSTGTSLSDMVRVTQPTNQLARVYAPTQRSMRYQRAYLGSVGGTPVSVLGQIDVSGETFAGTLSSGGQTGAIASKWSVIAANPRYDFAD